MNPRVELHLGGRHLQLKPANCKLQLTPSIVSFCWLLGLLARPYSIATLICKASLFIEWRERYHRACHDHIGDRSGEIPPSGRGGIVRSY